MRKKIKKKNKIKKFNKKPQSNGLLPVLAIVGLLSLFSETMRALPVGASSEKFFNTSFKLPILNNIQTEKKLLRNTFLKNGRVRNVTPAFHARNVMFRKTRRR